MDSLGGEVESGEKIDHDPQMHIMADLSIKSSVCILASAMSSCMFFLVSVHNNCDGALASCG